MTDEEQKTPPSKLRTIRKTYCSNCRGERNCEVVGHHGESNSEHEYYTWNRNWYILSCRGCDHVFAETVMTDSESYYHTDDGYVEPIETIASWPARSKRNRPEWFENGFLETNIGDTTALNDSLSELYGALDHDLNVLASIGMRTSFDIAAELLGIDSSKRFEQKVGDLVQKGLIKESEKDHIDILVDAGSASAHRGWKPREGDLSALMDTLEEFILNNLVLPARRIAAAEKIKNVKAKIPPRKKTAPKVPKEKAAPKLQKTKPATKPPS